MPTGRRARWMMYLQQFKFEIVHRPGKENSNADALSRMPTTQCFFIGVENIEGEEDSNLDSDFEYSDADYYSAEEDIDQILQLYREDKGKGKEISFINRTNEEQFGAFQDYLRNEDPEESASTNGWGETDAHREDLWRNDRVEDDTWGPNYPESEEADSDDDEIIEISANFPPQLLGLSNPNATSLGYQYTRQELERLYAQNIRIRQVIAGQPYTRGNGQCTFACDTENHHIHTYCTKCKNNLPYGTTVHLCVLPTRGEPFFVMDPTFLINNPWWTEPLPVQQHNCYIYTKFLQRMLLGLPFYTPEPSIAELD